MAPNVVAACKFIWARGLTTTHQHECIRDRNHRGPCLCKCGAKP